MNTTPVFWKWVLAFTAGGLGGRYSEKVTEIAQRRPTRATARRGGEHVGTAHDFGGLAAAGCGTGQFGRYHTTYYGWRERTF